MAWGTYTHRVVVPHAPCHVRSEIPIGGLGGWTVGESVSFRLDALGKVGGKRFHWWVGLAHGLEGTHQGLLDSVRRALTGGAWGQVGGLVRRVLPPGRDWQQLRHVFP